ncbi:MAG TPA: c-type cytochrome [Candidatus Avalokitesvara rifleensis]|uniref:c-type cytochrome n=1 Tax=Candidatus Avalokitesvara rifleensis TaxID=3367620 RepID=UPI0027133DD0|nr:c-type cytochrome [Candidatus Brocadiales bacterium]
MPENKDPIEQKSHVKLYIFAVGLLVFSTVWAVYDEVIGRRPWKSYQKQFLALADKKSQQDLKNAQAALTSEEYKALDQEYQGVLKAFEENPDRQAKVKELEEKDVEITELLHELQLHRGKYQSIVYIMEKLPEGEEKHKLLHEAQGLEPHIEQINAKIAADQVRKKELRKELAETARRKDKLQEELQKYQTQLANVQRFREALKKERVEIKQVVNGEIGLVDRCHSCHAGINRSEFDEAPEPFKSHPSVVTLPPLGPGLGERGILNVHPIEIFGCTPCHRGQGYATTAAYKAHGDLEYWDYPMLQGEYTQATCFKCHDYEVDVPGAEVLSRGRELFHKVGCIGCHSVSALKREDKTRFIGPRLDELNTKVYAGWVDGWLDNPRSFRGDTRMPHFLLNEEERLNVASYIWQITEAPGAAETPKMDEDMVGEGKASFETRGCLGCHRVGDRGSHFAPDLSRVGEKVRYDYLASWIADPKKHQPEGRMPNLRLDKEEAGKIAAYLVTLKENEPNTGAVDLNNAERAKEGFKIITRYGCFGCHPVKGLEDRGKIGADLSEEGVKNVERFDFALLEHELLESIGHEYVRENVSRSREKWLTTKLKDSRVFDKGKYKKTDDMLRMPDLSLTDEEVKALVTFVVGLTDENIPARYKRNLSEREKTVVDGTWLIRRYNCVGCHPFTLEKLTLADGTKVEGMTKLEEDETLFFQLWHDYPDMGKKLGENIAVELDGIKERIPTMGGEIVPYVIEYLGEQEDLVPEEARVFAPPFLYGEGKRVQADWLYRFVQSPYSLRPWVNVKMPTFGLTKEEAGVAAKFFALNDNQEYPYERLEEREQAYVDAECVKNPEHYVKARALMDSKDVNCGSCHVRGEIKPEGDPSGWAPDLSLARQRLRPGWIREWLTDPQRIQVGTKMPKFPWGEFQKIFPGKPEEQVEAIKDLIMSPGNLLTAAPATSGLGESKEGGI